MPGSLPEYNGLQYLATVVHAFQQKLSKCSEDVAPYQNHSSNVQKWLKEPLAERERQIAEEERRGQQLVSYKNMRNT